MKIGDLVRVKDNLQVGSFYGGIVFDKEMKDYKGKVGVMQYSSDGYIIIKGFNDYFDRAMVWSVDMIEPLKKEFTIYSSPTKFFIEKDSVFTEVEDSSTIKNVMNKYPKLEQICYEVDFNDMKYGVHKFKWYDSNGLRRLFDTGHIFTDIEKAQEIADKFNKIILDNQQKI